MDSDLDEGWRPGEAIRRAIADLSLSSKCIFELASNEAATVRGNIEKTFLIPGNEWSWERLRVGMSFWFSDPKWGGFIAIPYLCPDSPAWFLPVYDDEGEVFRGRPTIIAKVLEHTRNDEYAVVDTNLQWIVIENHHKVLFGSGEPVLSRLSEWLQRPGSNGRAFDRREDTRPDN